VLEVTHEHHIFFLIFKVIIRVPTEHRKGRRAGLRAQGVWNNIPKRGRDGGRKGKTYAKSARIKRPQIKRRPCQSASIAAERGYQRLSLCIFLVAALDGPDPNTWIP
jgi:hypothetical protein